MDKKLLVTLRGAEDAGTIRQTGVEFLAEYPDSVLVRSSEDQQAALEQAGLEFAPLGTPAIHLSGASFEFSSAREANELAPVTPRDPNRTAYYLVQCIGPVKREWLDTVRAFGGIIHGNMPSFTLIVGIPPAMVDRLDQEPWVEGITPYRPAMKVAPQLRRLESRTFGAEELATMIDAVPGTEAPNAPTQQIEISVFPGESTSAVAAAVRSAGGTVLAENPQRVTALAPPTAIAALAEREGVQAILPYGFPRLFNDRATSVMGVPPDHLFDGTRLTGSGQIVAVADSGLDTGDANTIHQDVRGRVVALTSFPTPANFAPFTNDPPSHDDGTDDRFSAHGTHVTGSVLGNGAAAVAAGATVRPLGAAPEARVYFQAVEQQVNWKTKAQLLASGITPPDDWPPPASGLYGLPDDLQQLFGPAYVAGARIHTNSWGSSNPETFRQYTGLSRDVDAFMFQHRDMLILFAAGNDGVDVNSDGVIDTGSISPPGTAKNALTVGASENNRPPGSIPKPGIDGRWDQLGGGGAPRWPRLSKAGHVSDQPDGMAAFSSRGPTAEGRIKPEIVAPGTNVLSMRSSAFPSDNPLWGDLEPTDVLKGRYCWSGGTSMSTPLTAGAAALLRQYLVDERHHTLPGGKPSGALIKAFLLSGASIMKGQFTGEVPLHQNPVCGFGRVNVHDAVTPVATILFDDEPDHAVTTGQMRVYRAAVSTLSVALKVTLVWTDAPSLPGNGSLENQLYLQVRTPGGAVLNGDITPFPTATNNAQQIVVEVPVAGDYEIRVRGVSITLQSPGATLVPAGARQDYALVVSNAITLTMVP